MERLIRDDSLDSLYDIPNRFQLRNNCASNGAAFYILYGYRNRVSLNFLWKRGKQEACSIAK